MTSDNCHLDSRSHLWGRTLSFVAVVVLLGVSVFSAAAQAPQNNPPNLLKHRPVVHPPLSSKDIAEGQSGVSTLAAVVLKNGTLTIDAHNSDLSQILRDISRDSGMIIQGHVRDARVFGSYGPQSPPDILSELLSGLGYNVIMVGTTRDGAPRELMLTARPDMPPSAQPLRVREETPPPELGPGAVIHPPPAQVDDPQVRARQNLQRLQQMHDSREREKIP